jgi:hypothetical protein
MIQKSSLGSAILHPISQDTLTLHGHRMKLKKEQVAALDVI